MERVVITGIGGICSIGKNSKEIFKSALEGRSGIDRIELFEVSPEHKTQIAAQVKGDVLTDIPARELRRIARATQFGIYSVKQAIEQASLDISNQDYRQAIRTGIVIGSSLIGMSEMIKESLDYHFKGPRHTSALLIPKIMPNAAAAVPAIRFGIHGPTYTTSAACASSATAVIDAFRLIAIGECDIVITGGCEDAIDPVSVASFANGRATSTRNEAPAQAVRPFDLHRDGFVAGEGSAIFVLESLSHARKRGATILAEILGCASNCDAYHIVQPDPSGIWQALCMQTAFERANIEPKDLDYINAHGTGTIEGDVVEAKAIAMVLNKAAGKVAVSSTKPAHGHMMSAAGAIELLISIEAILNNKLSPTINLEEIDPACSSIRHILKAEDLEVKIVASNSFGFGGENATIVISRFTDN